MYEIDYVLYFLIAGLIIGFIYSLVALGVTLIYGIINIPDFSHGNRYMLGAYGGFVAASLFGGGSLGYLMAIVAAMLFATLIAIASYLLVYKKIKEAPHITAFIAALGLLILLEGVARAIFGTQYYSIETPFSYVLIFDSVRLDSHRIVVLLASIILMIVLFYFLKKTTTGIALEATAQSILGAKIVGINTERMILIAFAISGALAGYAAALIAPISLIYPTMGAELNLKAFVICVVGGLGNIPGTIVSGLLLGLAETLFGAFVDMKWKNLVAFGILALVLCLKPEGIFAKGGRRT